MPFLRLPFVLRLPFILTAALWLCLTATCSAEDQATSTGSPPMSIQGVHLQRTMTLLATSTRSHRHVVHVLFYGQSITKQEWSQSVADDLHRRFPYADLTTENRAIGGFAANLLIRTAERDVRTFYPDLVIFHDYGGEPDYEAIIAHLRGITTADIALCNDHVTESQPNSWHDHHSNVWMPQIAAKYGCEFVDIRTPWKQYLKDNNLRPNALLKDGVHLNDQGNRLMASLIEPYLRYDPAISVSAWPNPVRTYSVGTDVHWTQGVLTLPFNGNRVDVVAADVKTGNFSTAEVFIDGKKPSEFPELYSYTRPGEQPGKDWPWDTGGILQINSEALPLTEEWTVQILDTNTDASVFHFTVTGSKTGFDGRGASDQPFVSNSKRVVIDAKDWWVKDVHDTPLISPGFEIKWRVLPLFTDQYQSPLISDPSQEYLTTLVEGLSNGTHILRLVAGKSSVPLKEIRVYQPQRN